MIFDSLHESAQRGELMLVDGGFCHWHLRRDGQLTIREIISTRPGAGSLMLRRLEATPGAESLLARCPAGLPANAWYARRGFHVARSEHTKSGRLLLVWVKHLVTVTRQPNVGDLEVIYCADGNSRLAEIAIDAGWIYGARLPAAGLPYRPYFTDQNWRQPARTAYMGLLAKYRPQLATVLDYEHADQYDEILDWAAEAAQYVPTIIIIPKVSRTISDLPIDIDGHPIRLGYSVPTRYAGTTVPLIEFADWPHGVHLLGGAPEKQIELARLLGNVRSADTNYHAKMALNYAKYWTPTGWRPLSADGRTHKRDFIYEAFRRSCLNILDAWRTADIGHETDLNNHTDLPLFAPKNKP